MKKLGKLFEDFPLLQERAVKPSPVIEEIEESWKHQVWLVESRKVTGILPQLSGDYSIEIVGQRRYVLGYEGQLRLVRMFDGRHTYSISNPLHNKVKIYCRFTDSGEFYGYTMNPAFGFHFLMNDEEGGEYIDICTGEMRELRPSTIEDVISNANGIVKLLETVNLTSIGKWHLPKTNPYRKIINDCYHSHDGDSGWMKAASEQLLGVGLINRVI